jgi:hypothetical protein
MNDEIYRQKYLKYKSKYLDLQKQSAGVWPFTKKTSVPTVVPTVAPTVAPTVVPTVAPTVVPTVAPTVVPVVVKPFIPGTDNEHRKFIIENNLLNMTDENFNKLTNEIKEIKEMYTLTQGQGDYSRGEGASTYYTPTDKLYDYIQKYFQQFNKEKHKYIQYLENMVYLQEYNNTNTNTNTQYGENYICNPNENGNYNCLLKDLSIAYSLKPQ